MPTNSVAGNVASRIRTLNGLENKLIVADDFAMLSKAEHSRS